MEFLTELWLPIVVAPVAVFAVSTIVHMVLKIHNKDCTKMENEDAVLDALRANNIAIGAYMFAGCDDMKEWSTDEHKAKMEKGPIGWLTVLPPNGFNMGRSLIQWFFYTLLVSCFTGYIAWHSLSVGADYLQVFQIVGAVAFMTYGLGGMPESIWKGVSWKVTGKFMFDGLLYALTTAGIFGAMWPSVAAATPSLPG